MIGSWIEGKGTRFRVWAPRLRRLELDWVGHKRVEMTAAPGGYFEAFVDGMAAGERYAYVLDGERRRPDPASRAQPDGVHAPSQLIDPAAFAWQHETVGRAVDEYVIYELHVGTFTPAGTFDAAAAQLGRLVDLGVTAVEIMPVASFPGTRNWGYDGVAWFAPQASYGGPEGLRRLVDACHAHKLDVVLDVVYNHFGPEGNYLADFGPYFTSRHPTPWGEGLDFDGEAARPVRDHVLASARMWVEEYRVDALRLDAVHAIADGSPRHIVAELTDEMRALGRRLGRRVQVIAESDLGDIKVIEAASESTQAWGCDAQWADDLHHALHAAVTGERRHYYTDWGAPSQVARALTDSFVFTGQWSPFRKRPYGMPAKHLPGERFVVCAQNHDQVGNRAKGERIGHLAEGCEHAVAAAYLLAPAVPLVFQGEEHADPAPFLYFTDHGDADLRRAVSEGRRREFSFADEVPDPQDEQTFLRSKIELTLGEHGRHAGLRRFYQSLLALRRTRPSLKSLDKTRTDARADDTARTLQLRRWMELEETLVLVALSPRGATLLAPAPRHGSWRVILDTGDLRFAGPRGLSVRDRDRALEVDLPGWGVAVCSNT